MNTVYLDSSAMVKLYVPEPYSIQTRAAVNRADLCASSTLARVEVLGAIARAIRGGRVEKEGAALVRAQALVDLAAITIVHVTDELLDHATALSEQHFLRAYDAVHLASALHLRDQLGSDVQILVFDGALRTASKLEGLLLPSRREGAR